MAIKIDFTQVRQVDSKPSASGFANGNIIFDKTEQKFYQALNNSWIALDFVGDDFAVNKLTFNTAATETLGVGELAWNTDDETVDMHVGDAVTIQLGQEMVYHVVNQTGSQIDNGTVVMADGALGASGKIKVVPAIADGSVPAKYIMGVATEDIPNGALGYVTAFGKVRGFNTSSYSSGTILYASATSSGSFTDTIPAAPNAKVTVAITLDQKNNGTIFVRPTFGSTFSENQDVTITSASNNDVLRFDSSTSVWVNEAFSSLETYSSKSDLTTALSGEYLSASAIINDLLDVNTSGATNNQILYYDASASTWETQEFSTQETYSSTSDLTTALDSRYLNPPIVTSLANLKALTAGEYEVVYLADSSVSTTGGRSGWFEWDSTDHSSATGTGLVADDPQNGVYVPPNSDTTGASGAWVRRYVGAVNVDWFGAIPDNYVSGTFNSITAINAAIDFVADAGFSGKVEFSRGRYTIGSPIQLRNSSWIAGNGYRSTQVKLSSNANCNVIELTSSSTWGTTVSDIFIDGNKSGNTSGTGIYYNNTTSTSMIYTDAIHTIQNVFIAEANDDGMYLSADARETRVRNVYCIGAGRYGFNIQATDSFFEHCVTASSGHHGWYLRSPNTRIVNCKGFGSGQTNSSGSDGSAFAVQGNRITLVACEAQESKNHGFLMLGSNRCNLVSCIADSNANAGFRLDDADFCNVNDFLVFDTSGLAETHNMGVTIISTSTKNRIKGIIDLSSSVDYEDFAASGSNIIEFMLQGGTVYTDSP